MALIIALLISLGVITSGEEATPEQIEAYQDHPSIVVTDIDDM